jgi:hypothetical protein
MGLWEMCVLGSLVEVAKILAVSFCAIAPKLLNLFILILETHNGDVT